jgi:hypothetical protein
MKEVVFVVERIGLFSTEEKKSGSVARGTNSVPELMSHG